MTVWRSWREKEFDFAVIEGLEGMEADCTSRLQADQTDVCLFSKELDEKVAKFHFPAQGAAFNVPARGNALSWDRADHRTLKPGTLLEPRAESYSAEFVARQTALAGSSSRTLKQEVWSLQRRHSQGVFRIVPPASDKKSELRAHQMALPGRLRTFDLRTSDDQ